MIRILLDKTFDTERHYIHAVGLSTDTKPTTGIITGSKFVAVDTGAGYLFDETAGEWNENPQLSEAVAAYLDEHPEALDQAAIEAMFSDQLDAIEAEQGVLKSALNDLEEDVNGVISYNYTEGKKITANNSGYSIDDDAGTCVSELIEITWGWDTSTYVRYYYNGVSGETLNYRIIFFDENKNYIGWRGTDGVEYRAVTNVSGGKYVQFSFKRGTIGKLMQNLAPQTVYWEASSSVTDMGLNDRVDALETEVGGKVDKAGTNQVTLKNCDFAYYSPNLFDPSNVVSGLLNKSTGAIIERYTNFRTSEFIPVSALTDYVISSGQQFHVYYCWYGTTQNYLSGAESGVNTTLSLTSPANSAYFRMSMTLEQTGYNVQFEAGSTPTEYMPFGDGYILPQYIRTVHEAFPLNLPSKVYALVGTEINLYFDNMVDGRYTDYDFDITCSVGMQLERGYRITAASADAGTYTVTVKATRKSDGSVAEKTATLVVTDTSAGSGDSASVIILGDSTTDNPYVTGKIHTDFSEDVMTISTIGTRGTAPNNHEGRSGWRFEYYFTQESMTYTDGRGTIYNPFYNPSTQTFDAAYYFANSGIAKPDYFVINLGINDMFGALSDAQLATSIESGIGYCDSMIASIKSASPNTKVVVCMTIPPNYSQDAFGKEYKNNQTRARYKRNNILWVERLIQEYDDREAENIYLCPISLSLDTIYNMGLETMPVNARNTAITYESPIANGGVHPAESGYWQIADVYTAFLKANAE